VALVTNAATLNEQVDPDMLIAQLKGEIKKLKATIASSSIKPVSNNSSRILYKSIDQTYQLNTH